MTMAMKQFRNLDLWFAAFPVWSTVFYIWALSLLIPAGGRVTPMANPDSPQFISWPMLWLAMLCLALVMGSFLTTCVLLERRTPGDSRRWWWIALALFIPPLGCPLAYFQTRSESPQPRGGESMSPQ
jgi:hypothetical protein